MNGKPLIIVAIGLFILLAGVPLLLVTQPDPLVPPAFAVTATRYQETASFLETREIEQMREATSIIITLPPVEEALPGDPDYTPPAGSDSSRSDSIILVNNPQQPAPVTGQSTEPLTVYTCPVASQATDGSHPAGERFTILGHAYDLNETLYLLIDDSPPGPQRWLQVNNPGNIELSAPLNRIPRISCRPANPTAEGNLSPEAERTSEFRETSTQSETIPLPQPITATPVMEAVQFVITGQDATDQIAETIPELQNPQVQILEDEIQIEGDIEVNAFIRGNLVARGVLETFESETGFTKLRIDILSLTVAGRDYTGRDEEGQVEVIINNWFRSLLRGSDVQSYVQEEDLLTIDALQREGIRAEETAEATPDPDVSPTITATFVIITATTGPTSTPITGSTATATPENLPTSTPIPVRTSSPQSPTPDSAGDSARRIDEATALNSASSHIDDFPVNGVTFQNNQMQISGQITSALPGNQTLPFTISGTLVSENGRTRFLPVSLTVDGETFNLQSVPGISQAINAWLPTLTGKNVEDLTIEDGALVINPTNQD